MGEFREAEDTDDLGRALQERACPTCRRALQPWDATCPDDGTPTIRRSDLPALEDELVAGLGLNPALFDDLDDDEPGEDGPGDDGPGDQAFTWPQGEP